MTIQIEVNGTLYERFTEATVDLRLDALSSSFSFFSVGDERYPIPFAPGDECRVFVDDTLVLTGHIELVTADGDHESHDVVMAGRDRTADVLDSTLGAMNDMAAPISLKRVCEAVIAHLAPNTASSERLQVVDQVSPPLFNRAEDLIAAEPGVGAFEFLEQWARKRTCLLTSNADGNLVIADPSGTEIEAWVHQRKESTDNNVRAYSMSHDQTGLYNVYRLQSQLNPNALNWGAETSAAVIVDQQGQVNDSLIREGRQMVLVSESAFSGSENTKRATWERNVRRARGRVFAATVASYKSQTGELWQPNTLPWVISEAAGINTRMLVNSVRFSLTPDTGYQTALSFVERDAYTLDLQEPSEESEAGSGLGALSG